MRRCVTLIFMALLLGGCQGANPSPQGTGAKETAQRYYEAIIQQDWAKAYSTLHPDTSRNINLEQFTASAKRFRQRIGFEPGQTFVRSCDEQAQSAMAHIVICGQPPHTHLQFMDAIAMHRTEGGWAVVLPENFGH
jgi:hypothetical protein